MMRYVSCISLLKWSTAYQRRQCVYIRMYIIYSQGGFRLGGMPFTSDNLKLKRFLKRKFRCTGVGPLTGGGSQFQMSIIRNINVALSNLGNDHVTVDFKK